MTRIGDSGFSREQQTEYRPNNPAVDSALNLLEQSGAAGAPQAQRHHQSQSGREIHNRDGTTVDVDRYGRVVHIDRTDGTSIDASYAGKLLTQIVEHRRHGFNVQWDRDPNSDNWHTMQFIGATRLHFRPHVDGTVTFGTPNGTEFTFYGDNSCKLTTEKNSQITIDTNDKITAVHRADGTDINCQYNGNTLEHIIVTRNGVSQTWDRQPGDVWTSKQTSEVRRNFAISDSGNSSYVSSLSDNVVRVEYFDGNHRDFEWQNGRVVQVTEKGPNGTEIWQRQGDTNNWTNGKGTETRFNVRADASGNYSYDDANGLHHIYKFDDSEEKVRLTEAQLTPDEKHARDAMLASAQAKITDQKQLDQFKADTYSFVQRAATVGLSDKQITDTFDQIRQVLDSTVAQPALSQQDRTTLARELMHHVAFPRSIDQGDHGTCGAAVLEVIAAARSPERLTNIVRQIADTGKYVSPFGETVALDEQSLQPDFEARQYSVFDNDSGTRSFASQLFQIAAINAGYQALNQGMRYTQGRPTSGSDTGERNIDLKTGTASNFTGLSDTQVLEMSRQTIGEPVTLLRRGTNFDTQADLANQLSSLQRNHALPAVLGVHTSNEPFWTATGKGRTGGNGSGHYVTVWDVDNDGRVLVDNQWGRPGDYESLKRLPMDEVYNATRWPN